MNTTTTHDRLVPAQSRFLAGALVLALVALPLWGAPLAAQDQAPTVAELIEKNLEAKGGREAMESLESARLTGTMTMGAGGQQMEAPISIEWKAPTKVRREFTLQGMTGIQAYDGETGWMLMPFMGKSEPEKMSAEDEAMIKEDADLRGQLFNPEDKGLTVEYGGEEEIEGTPTHKVTVTGEDGEVTHYFLDQEYFLEIHSRAERTIRGQEMTIDTTISGYKPVGDLVLAHSLDQEISTGQGGAGSGFSLTIESVELNPEVPEERFAMPEVEGESENGGQEDGR